MIASINDKPLSGEHFFEHGPLPASDETGGVREVPARFPNNQIGRTSDL
jgi:hypothetical protein